MSRTKSLQIVLVVIAGSLAGAGLMKVLPRAKAPEPPPPVAAVQPPAPPVERSSAPALPKPDPFVEPKPKPAPPPSPVRSHASAPRMVAAAPPPRPVYRPLPQRPAEIRPVRIPAPAPAPPSQESRTLSSGLQRRGPVVEPSPNPPARPEPEHVTPAPPSSPAPEPKLAPPPAPAKPAPVTPPAPEPHRVTLNAGMLISVRLVEGMSAERNRPGDPFTATLDHELIGGEFVVAERGARVDGRVASVDYDNRTLTVSLTYLYTSDGQQVPIRTDVFSTRGPMLPRDSRITFRLGLPVRLTERTQ